MSNTIQPLTSLYFNTKMPLTQRSYHLDVVTPADRIPPFQIRRAQNTHPLADITVEAVYPESGAVVDLKALRDPATPMQLLTMSDGTDLIIWDHIEANPFIADITGGRFYVKVSDTVNTWYSQYMLRVSCTNSESGPPMYDLGTDLETEIPTT